VAPPAALAVDPGSKHFMQSEEDYQDNMLDDFEKLGAPGHLASGLTETGNAFLEKRDTWAFL
jgi:hypothetical protein